MRFERIITRVALPLASLLLVALLLEAGLRGLEAARGLLARDVPRHVLVDAPFLYALNPEHPEVGPQGLRDDVVPISRRAATPRILVLGDSVVYGDHVARHEAFPDRLEQGLGERVGPVEVVNAGVAGYSVYNELHYYRARGRGFDPDLVLVGFCMNDVANPRLHWSHAGTEVVHVPDAAIPNPAYDREVIQPRLRAEAHPPLWKRSQLARLLRHRIGHLLAGPDRTWPAVPTLITGEDSLGIEVLLDEDSPEWRWLTSLYDEFHEEVRADGKTLVVLLFPLAYQLDAGYPHRPQERLLLYCARRQLACLDLLPALRRHPPEQVFLMDRMGFRDVWHLTPFGHQVVGDALRDFLLERQLLPLASDGPGPSG